MPKVKKTNVTKVTSSSNPEIVANPVYWNTPIAPLELDFGRADLNLLVEKINEIIKKK